MLPDFEPFSIDPIFEVIEQDLLKSGRYAKEAVETILTIEPGLLQLKTERPWGNLLTQAIHIAKTSVWRDTTRLLQLMNLRSKYYLHSHQEVQAYDSFKEMLDFAEKQGLVYYQMEAYIGLLQVHTRLPSDTFNQELINQLLDATTVTSLEQKRRFSHALANFGVHQGNHALCIAYGNIVYQEWEREGNRTEMARIAHALSHAYRLDGNLKAANHWHETAQWAYTLSGDLRDKAVLAYSWGSQMLYAEDYREAEYWMRVAMKEYGQLADQHGQMTAAHGLAIAIAYNNTDFAEGLRLLDEAVAFWETKNNNLHIAHAYHTYGFLHEKMGNHHTAKWYLKEGIRMFDDLPITKLNQVVSNKMQELYDLIDRGGNVEDLKPKG